MKNEKTLKDFQNYYDQRYNTGYNPQWPVEQKQRVFDLLRSLDLPETGSVLDFGCGRGEFSKIIKQALPNWNVFGVDISSIAVEDAKKNCQECSFSVLTQISAIDQKFDLVFSNHVLEHVDDLGQTWAEMNQLFKQKAWFLLILPCGNAGSFEYKLCMLQKNGIEKDKGNRFYNEDETHLRRLTSDEMNRIVLRNDFKPVFNYFNNHFYGAIYWITIGKPWGMWAFFNPTGAKDFISGLKLIGFYCLFMLIKCLKFPANTIDYKKATMKSSNYWLFFVIFLLFYPFSKLIKIYLDYKAKQEWDKNKTKPTGSEMYLFYSRG
ncbi:MAG: methyltransferase domain-containing protein [Candidatus Omnitrophica bacterium]|nr:methyltransferase domain-containing protein [Candidatus Omnitrophota bacterium]